ncbi:MAG: endonuclease/exonuclease/phosphatase family protein [Clostridiales bacterium]|nr:endonuclease/exonuclease/phosphatase family protein [Clostridiales bacterium]
MKKQILSRLLCLILLLSMAFSFSACDNLPKATVDLSFMSFNIRNENSSDTDDRAWDNRKSAFFETVLRYDVDIVCFQEVKRTQNEDFQTNLTEKYQIIYYARTPKTNEEGLAIAFDKEKFSLVSDNVFWFCDTPDEWDAGWGATQVRICVNAVLKHKESGLKINVFNVHLDNKSAESRIKSVNMVLKKVKAKEYPAFVLGDFNCRVGSEPYNKMAKSMYDCQAKASITDSGCTYQGFGADENTQTNTAIDFCFTTKKYITPVKFEICRDKWGENSDKYLSDHYAIKMDVRYKKS